MNSYAIVRPEHLNHHGYLFGGAVLKWVDEYAWLTASLDYPGCSLVTIAMDDIVFRERIICGSILRFQVLRKEQGNTSVSYNVDIFSDAPGATEERHVFSTTITFVRLDENSQKTRLPDTPNPRSNSA